MIRCWARGFALLALCALFSAPRTNDLHAALPPLSAEAVESLRQPPAQLDPSVARELEAIWAERSGAFMRSVMNGEAYDFESLLWIDRLAGKPYLHFKASGQNRGYAEEPRRNVVVVLFIGPTAEEINTEFGSWFAPFQDGRQFIEAIDMGAQRAAHTNITDDGTHSIYWQEENAFIEVRSRSDVLGLARQAHAEARRSGIYSFPQSYLLTSFADGAGAVSSTLGGGPASATEATPTPTPTPTPAPTPPPQPSQNELATGWERVEEQTKMIQPQGENGSAGPEAAAPQPTPARTRAATPRIPAATLGLALHAAIRRDEPSPVTALIRAGAGVEARDDRGRTPLMTAAVSASPELVRLLIENGARLEAIPVGPGVAPREQGMTPLMFAARAGRADLIEVLIEAGASPAVVNGQGRTALEIARAEGNTEALRALQRAAGIEPEDAPGAQGAAPGAMPSAQGGPVAETATTTETIESPGSPSASSGGPGLLEQEIEALATGRDAMLATSVGSVRLWQARLEGAWKRLNVDLNEDSDATVLRAVILNWDARVRPASTGATGYEYWREALAELSPDNPLTAAEPSAGLSDERVVEALRIAAARLRRDFDAIEVPYSRESP